MAGAAAAPQRVAAPQRGRPSGRAVLKFGVCSLRAPQRLARRGGGAGGAGATDASADSQSATSLPILDAAAARGDPGVFLFRHFAVRHAAGAHKVGTDAMLLGAWAAPSAAERRILDVGAGTGVLALMAAQRAASGSAVDAVEADAAAAAQAAANFAAAPFRDVSLTAHAARFQEFAVAAPGGRYDLLLSNPPFFMGGTHSSGAPAAAARHAGEHSLPSADLAVGAAALLAPGGRLCVVLPAGAEAAAFCGAAATAGLAVARRCAVRTRADDAAPKRCLLELRAAPPGGAAPAAAAAEEEERLAVQVARGGADSGGGGGGGQPAYTAEYLALTAPFHHPDYVRRWSAGGGRGGQ